MAEKTQPEKKNDSRYDRERADIAWAFEQDFQSQIEKIERWIDLSPYEKYLGRFRDFLSAAWTHTYISEDDGTKKYIRASMVRVPLLTLLLIASMFTPLFYQFIPLFAAYWLLALVCTAFAYFGVARKALFHFLVMLDILTVTFVVHMFGSLTSVEVVFYPIMVILLTLAFGFPTGFFYACVVNGIYTSLIILEGTGILPYSPMFGHEFPAYMKYGIPTYPIVIIVCAHVITFGGAVFTGVMTYEIEIKRRQANSAVMTKNEMLAICSHDLKNLLVSITGYSELMLLSLEQKQIPVSDLTVQAQQIHASGNRMLELIFNLLDSARLENGSIPLTQKKVSLQEVIRSVVKLQEPNASLKQTELVCRMPDEIVWVDADHSKIVQVFTNLVQNAIIYTPEKGRVGVELSGPAGGKVRAVVRDTGPGIAQDVLPILFDPIALAQRRQALGRRLGNSLSTGLGLSIVKKFVEMHGGNLWVESPEGDGSAFWIELPVAARPVESPAEDPAAESAPVAAETAFVHGKAGI